MIKKAHSVLLIAFFLLLFLPQSILFAKWTRYMIPTLPFIYLIVGIAISEFLQVYKRVFGIKYIVLCIVSFTSVLFALSYFITAFVMPDTRIAAEAFAQRTISPNTRILSEVYDLGITPFNGYYHNIEVFNFYDLDNNSPQNMPEALRTTLESSEYIILPSPRILKTRLIHKDQFPYGHMFYNNLFNGSLGFQKVYETPCDFWCKVVYLGDPVFSFEETANVFDRPTVFIFKKI